MPLLRQGGVPSGFLVAALNRYRALDDGYRGFVDPRRRAHRRRHRPRPQLPGAAAAGRGARRTRPRQDHVLLQHQPRVPHTADVDPRSGGRAAPGRRRRRADARGTGRGVAQRTTSHQAGQHAAGLLPHRGRSDPGALRTGRPGRRHRRACQRLPLRRRARRPDLRGGLPVAGRTGLHRPRHVGEGGLQPALECAEVHLRRRHLRAVHGASGTTRSVTVADTGIGVPAAEMPRLFERFHRIENAPCPVQRGQRHRPGAGQGTGRPARRHHRRGQHRGRGHHLHRSAAVRHRASA